MMTSGRHEAQTNEPPEDSAASQADAAALLEEAEAEAAAAEAVAAAAQARARAARLRREARGVPEPAEDYGDDEDYDEDYDETADEDYDEDYDEDVDAAEHVAEPAEWQRWIPTIAVVAAIILIICFAGVSAYMVLQHRDTTTNHQREAAFVAGAKRGVLNMISLDFNKAKEDVQRVIDSSTGQFKDDFQRGAKDFISVVTQSKTITEGSINAAAVQSMDRGSAVVLVAATSEVTNSPPGTDEPPRIWRLKVTVADVGGQYKMSRVEYIP